jgi:hypothetical protein
MLLAGDERKLQNFHHGRDTTNDILRKVMEADSWSYLKKFVNSCRLARFCKSGSKSYFLLLSRLRLSNSKCFKILGWCF